MRRLQSPTVRALAAVFVGVSIPIADPYIPNHWGWFATMTVFGMAGGFVISLAIGTVMTGICLGAAFGELLIMAGKPELSANAVAWAIFACFAFAGLAAIHQSDARNNDTIGERSRG